MANKKYLWIPVFLLLFAAGMTGGYFYFSKKFPSQALPAKETEEKIGRAIEDMFTLRIYYPAGGRLQMEERKVQRKTIQMTVAEAVISEFLKGPVNVSVSEIPKDAKLIGLYRGDDGMLYVDLSDEFRRNFGGDAAAEFLLLRGLYESLISNVYDITDVKILIEGREMESLGGHLYLSYPLKDIVYSDLSDSLRRTGDKENNFSSR
ncbi:MAG: GerMN domain-containing protein [Thermodesulfovibrionales bacterium]|nr:GerMN domain-containing protein [Thermodesulfovibrionales bacterium]